MAPGLTKIQQQNKVDKKKRHKEWINQFRLSLSLFHASKEYDHNQAHRIRM